MEKKFLEWSYWQGLARMIVAILWRIANAFSGISPNLVVTGKEITYWSFVRGGGILLVISIATAGYRWSRQQA